jgi:peptide/nickel transport system permease protein
MHRYVINRILLMIPTLLGVAIISFVLLRMVPGDIVLLKLAGDGGQVDASVLQQERAKLGLDKPIAQQFVDWIWGAIRLDFGLSMWTGRPIIQEIAVRLELSLELAIMASIIATVLALPLGALAALRQDTWVDYTHQAVQHRRPGHAGLLGGHHHHPLSAGFLPLSAAAHLYVAVGESR